MTGSPIVVGRRRGRTAPPKRSHEDSAVDDWEPFGELASAPLDEVLSAVARGCDGDSNVLRAADMVLTFLAEQAGDTWQDRWLAGIDTFTSDDRSPWFAPAMAIRRPSQKTAESATRALQELVSLDVVRPTYAWMARRRLQCWPAVAQQRDPVAWDAFRTHLHALGFSPKTEGVVQITVAQIVAATGKPVNRISAEDVLEMARSFMDRRAANRRQINLAWRVLRELGWLKHASVAMPTRHKRRPPKTCEEMVDGYGIAEPQRSVLVHYLRARSTSLDHVSLHGVAFMLCDLFWADIVRHEGTLPGFALTEEQASAWKERVKLRKLRPGQEVPEPRRDFKKVLNTVRAFYSDVASWALHDSFWAPWVAPPFIYAEDTAGTRKDQARTTSRIHQRIREAAPLLSQVVRAAEERLDSAREMLTAALTAGPGGNVEVDGRQWRVVQDNPRGHLRLVHGTSGGPRGRGNEIDVTDREDAAFWAWAAIEILQHTGIRIEELLELTHLSLVPHRVRETGETIPLLHIAPSKSDEERLLVVGPELAHVLACVIARIRGEDGQVPLVQRYDPHERVWSDLLPFLFQGRRRGGVAQGVISDNVIRNQIQTCIDLKGIKVKGQPLKLVPHDFRRIFATEALAAGVPPHITQALMGHKSIATTQGYAAVYPQHVIAGHRAFIARRRKLRPTEEYRALTDAEWEEFEGHFAKRKLELGTCGRAYGSDCRHEHACIRCEMLRPDPAQRGRLLVIIDSLGERITEATENGWLGEVDGLQTSLDAARVKLWQMERIERRQASGAVALPLPSVRVRPR